MNGWMDGRDHASAASELPCGPRNDHATPFASDSAKMRQVCETLRRCFTLLSSGPRILRHSRPHIHTRALTRQFILASLYSPVFFSTPFTSGKKHYAFASCEASASLSRANTCCLSISVNGLWWTLPLVRATHAVVVQVECI